MPTAKDVAKWMADEIARTGELYQLDAAEQIKSKFGKGFVYWNDNGGLAIDRQVLLEFRKFTAANVIWIRGERYWRRREPGDEKARRQD